MRRKNESSNEHQAGIDAQKERQKTLRQNENFDEHRSRIDAQKERQKTLRQNESDLERQIRKKSNAISHQVGSGKK